MVEAGGRGPRLIGIARVAIERGASPVAVAPGEAWLSDRAATFVTLRLDGELRGCIGSLEARRPLADDVAHNAYAAAYRDPRFSPVTADERAGLGIEVSVLSPRVPIDVPDEASAASILRPGVDGIYLEYGGSGATFLPQVWESIPDPLEFLAALRHKAGLPVRFWHRDVRLWRYSVEKYA